MLRTVIDPLTSVTMSHTGSDVELLNSLTYTLFPRQRMTQRDASKSVHQIERQSTEIHSASSRKWAISTEPQFLLVPPLIEVSHVREYETDERIEQRSLTLSPLFSPLPSLSPSPPFVLFLSVAPLYLPTFLSPPSPNFCCAHPLIFRLHPVDLPKQGAPDIILSIGSALLCTSLSRAPPLWSFQKTFSSRLTLYSWCMLNLSGKERRTI